MLKIILKVTNRFNRWYSKYQWRKANPHNATKMKNYFRPDNVTVGEATYGILDVIDYSPKESKLNIGNYCSIAPNVVFVLGGEHSLNTLSTFPFKARLLQNGVLEAGSKGDINIKDDVWIGVGATIMSGVTIGQGAVIGANSLVNKNVPPYAIVGGVPAKIIKYRFSEEIVKKLIKLDYSKLKKRDIVDSLEMLCEEVTDENIDGLIKKILDIKR